MKPSLILGALCAILCVTAAVAAPKPHAVHRAHHIHRLAHHAALHHGR
jgi:hypothetical protein